MEGHRVRIGRLVPPTRLARSPEIGYDSTVLSAALPLETVPCPSRKAARDLTLHGELAAGQPVRQERLIAFPGTA